jgi:hypothetical protein
MTTSRALVLLSLLVLVLIFVYFLQVVEVPVLWLERSSLGVWVWDM